MTTKDERLRALKRTLKPLLTKREYVKAVALLYMFRYVYTMKDKADKAKWPLSWFYVGLGLPWLAKGYPLDLHIDATIGKKFFGEFSEPDDINTLTATLKRVKGAKTLITNVDHTGNFEDVLQYCDPKYGCVSVEYYNLAVQICAVLNDWDEGHC